MEIEAQGGTTDSDGDTLLLEPQPAVRTKRNGLLFGMIACFALAGTWCASMTNPSPARTADVASLQNKAASTVDLLTITKIKCLKPAGGIDAAGIVGFAALGAAVAGGGTWAAATLSTGGAANAVPLTAKIVAVAALEGASYAADAAKMLNGRFSGQDDLIVKVDGMQVVPSSGLYLPMNAGQTIRPNIRVSMQGHARISLLEYDSGSDNDDLGSLDIQGGSDRAQDEVIVLAPRDEDGSIYYISYKVEAGKGDPKDIAGYVLCGTNQCDACQNEDCVNQDYSNIDRDKDKPDLKACPQGMVTSRYQHYPQWWPAADVYARVCKRDAPRQKSKCEVSVYQHGSFDGWKVTFDEGKYDHGAMTSQGVVNDQISSMQVGPACKATLYQHGWFNGDSAVFTQGDYNYHDMIKKFKNDDASSLVVERVR